MPEKASVTFARQKYDKTRNLGTAIPVGAVIEGGSPDEALTDHYQQGRISHMGHSSFLFESLQTSKHLEARQIVWQKQAWSDVMEDISGAADWYRKHLTVSRITAALRQVRSTPVLVQRQNTAEADVYMWHTDPVNYRNNETEPLPPSMLACKFIYAECYQAAHEQARAMESNKPQIYIGAVRPVKGPWLGRLR